MKKLTKINLFLVCKSEFCVLDAFMTHLKDVHPDTVNVACQCCQESIQKQKMPRHLLTHRIGIYECIYCKFGTDTMEAIQVHVCNQHPMEPFYCCVRYNKTPGKVCCSVLVVLMICYITNYWIIAFRSWKLP